MQSESSVANQSRTLKNHDFKVENDYRVGMNTDASLVFYEYAYLGLITQAGCIQKRFANAVMMSTSENPERGPFKT